MARKVHKKKFEFDCVNKVKYESKDDFRTSIFEDVYDDAFLMTQESMKENEARKNLTKADNFCNENEVRNVISFIGQRGMGKSSAMLSYAYFLKEYNSDNVPLEFKFEAQNPSFCTLTKIDAATLTSSETLFDVILAKMWELFIDEMAKRGDEDYLYAKTREKFTEIKDTYVIYNTNDKNLSMVRQLKDLSKSLNLRNNFAELVDAFLDCIITSERVAACDKYLVISIDDLDMANECMEQVLEQLRIFLSVPKVIILASLDVDKLLMHACKRMEGLYARAKANQMHYYEEKMISTYAEQYIAKVLPRNRRIYMPDFSGNNLKNLVIDYNKYASNIYDTQGSSEMEIGYVQYVGAVLAKTLNVLLPPQYMEKDTQAHSLRDLTNQLNELWKISKVKDNYRATRMAYEWMTKDVAIMGNRMVDMGQKSLIDVILHISEDVCNNYVINYMGDNSRSNIDSYGKMMEVLFEYQKESLEKKTITGLIIQLYSARMSYLLKEENYENLEEQFVKKDIFDTAVRKRGNRTIGTTVDISGMLACGINLCGKKSLQYVVKEAVEQFENRFFLLLFCDVEEILSKVSYVPRNISVKATEVQRILEKQQEADGKLQLVTDAYMTIPSIDKFMHNIIRCGELYEKYIKWLEIELPKFKIVTQEGNAIIRRMQENDKIRRIEQWKENNAIQNFYDFIPVQDIGVLTDAVAKFESEFLKFMEPITETTQKIFECMEREFEKVEKIYNYEGLSKKSYSLKIRELYKILELKKIPDNLAILLGVYGEEYDDTIF